MESRPPKMPDTGDDDWGQLESSLWHLWPDMRTARAASLARTSSQAYFLTVVELGVQSQGVGPLCFP